jgi:hypothetical protein
MMRITTVQAAMIGVVVIGACFVVAAKMLVSAEAERDSGPPEFATKACGRLVGLGALKSNPRDLSSLAQIGSFYGALGCRTEVVRVADLSEDTLPAWVETETGYALLVAMSSGGDSVCVAEETLVWQSREELNQRLVGKDLLQVTSSKVAGAKLVALEDSFFLGSTGSDGGAERLVTLFNIGDKSLVVSEQQFSCGCASASLSSEKVFPGGFCTAKLRMELNPNTTTLRTVQWFVACSPPDASLMVDVAARSEKKTRISPQHFQLGRLRPSKSDFSIQTTVKCTGACESVLVEPVFLSDGVSVAEVKRGTDQAVVTFHVRSLEAKRDHQGRFSIEAILAVEGCAGTRELYSVTGAGSIVPEVSVEPRIVNAGMLEAGEIVEAKVALSAVLSVPIVTSAHPGIVSATSAGSTITLRIQAPDTPGFFKTGILLRVGADHVHVPIHGFVVEDGSVHKQIKVGAADP